MVEFVFASPKNGVIGKLGFVEDASEGFHCNECANLEKMTEKKVSLFLPVMVLFLNLDWVQVEVHHVDISVAFRHPPTCEIHFIKQYPIIFNLNDSSSRCRTSTLSEEGQKKGKTN